MGWIENVLQNIRKQNFVSTKVAKEKKEFVGKVH